MSRHNDAPRKPIFGPVSLPGKNPAGQKIASPGYSSKLVQVVPPDSMTPTKPARPRVPDTPQNRRTD
jgi:hypothetical protein